MLEKLLKKALKPLSGILLAGALASGCDCGAAPVKGIPNPNYPPPAPTPTETLGSCCVRTTGEFAYYAPITEQECNAGNLDTVFVPDISLQACDSFRQKSDCTDIDNPILPAIPPDERWQEAVPLSTPLNSPDLFLCGRPGACILVYANHLTFSPNNDVTNTKHYTLTEHFEIGNASLETGLSLARFGRAHELFQQNVMLYLPYNSLAYSLFLEQPLNEQHKLTQITPNDFVSTHFLDQKLFIESASPDSITGWLAHEFSGLHVGDSFCYYGKKLTLEAIATSSVAVTVDGETLTIPHDNQRIFSPASLRVRAEDVLARGTAAEEKSSVTLLVGRLQDHGRFSNGDAFVGQDKYSPLWIWELHALDSNRPHIGITLNASLTSYNAGAEYPDYGLAHPPSLGEAICLPRNYACLVLDRMNQNDEDFGTINVRWMHADLVSHDGTHLSPNHPALEHRIVNDGSIHVLPEDITTKAIFLASHTNNDLHLYAENPNGQVRDTGKFSAFGLLDNNTAGGINTLYRDTLVPSFFYSRLTYSVATLSLRGDEQGWLLNSLDLFLQHDSNGSIKGLENIWYNYQPEGIGRSFYSIQLTNWKEPTRTPEGIIIEGENKTQETTLRIPPDLANYKGVVRIVKP